MDRALPPPSRNSNPFATCWTRPGAVEFVYPHGENAESLIARLAANNWRGEITGPHGAGKSTLLETLRPAIVAAGRTVKMITLRDGQHRLPRGWLHEVLASSLLLVVIDGYEQLSLLSRVWLRLRCRMAGAGLVVTSHASTGLPPLIHLAPTRPLVDQLVAALTARTTSPITADDVAAGVACHGSNVRELLFSLYRRHEERLQSARTAAAVPA